MTARTVVAPREVVAWVIREGTERGKGRYLYSSDPHCQPGWSETSVVAERWKTGNASDARSTAEWVRGRVVRIVRPEPRDWAKLIEEHAALTAKVARLTANHTDWLRLLADTRAALGVEAGGSLIDAANRLTARVARLADIEADRDRLRLACDAIAEERDGLLARLAELELEAASSIERLSLDLGACQADRDAWKARAEAAEGRGVLDKRKAKVLCEVAAQDEREACATWLREGHQESLATAMLRARGSPAPARVLRDGEGGCEPLPTPAKPQPPCGLYALSEIGYVLTRRGCDLLDALARGRS